MLKRGIILKKKAIIHRFLKCGRDRISINLVLSAVWFHKKEEAHNVGWKTGNLKCPSGLAVLDTLSGAVSSAGLPVVLVQNIHWSLLKIPLSLRMNFSKINGTAQDLFDTQ